MNFRELKSPSKAGDTINGGDIIEAGEQKISQSNLYLKAILSETNFDNFEILTWQDNIYKTFLLLILLRQMAAYMIFRSGLINDLIDFT